MRNPNIPCAMKTWPYSMCPEHFTLFNVAWVLHTIPYALWTSVFIHLSCVLCLLLAALIWKRRVIYQKISLKKGWFMSQLERHKNRPESLLRLSQSRTQRKVWSMLLLMVRLKLINSYPPRPQTIHPPSTYPILLLLHQDIMQKIRLKWQASQIAFCSSKLLDF